MDRTKDLLSFCRTCRPFGLKPLSSKTQVEALLTFATVSTHAEGETLFEEGDRPDKCFMVIKGTVTLTYRGVDVYRFDVGQTFGEVGFLDEAPRRATAVCDADDVTVLSLTRDALTSPDFPASLTRELYGYLGKRVTRLLLGEDFYDNVDVLIVQDGGCAPGYNAVTSYLAEAFERSGRRVFVAMEGFRSLASGKNTDFGLLVTDVALRELLSSVPRVYDAAQLRSTRGAAFRSERFPDFKKRSVQLAALNAIRRRRVKTVVCVGGNGTMRGAIALSRRCKEEGYDDAPQLFFVPVTIDSDVRGTETIGAATGVEMGAEKLRCYCADAFTHQRCYIKEMMGAEGGYHALHSAVGAGAHYAALSKSLTRPELERVAKAISRRRSTVIAVAEGYARALRRNLTNGEVSSQHLPCVVSTSGRPGQKDLVSAATFLHFQLKSTGMLDASKKVVCESFARDLRGAAPNNLDIFLSQQMAMKVAAMARDGETDAMPAVNSGVVSSIRFKDLDTCNDVDAATAALADRL